MKQAQLTGVESLQSCYSTPFGEMMPQAPISTDLQAAGLKMSGKRLATFLNEEKSDQLHFETLLILRLESKYGAL